MPIWLLTAPHARTTRRTGACPSPYASLAEAGFGDRLLLGGDTTTAGARSVNGGPGMPYLLRRVRPRLELALGTQLVERILTANPQRAYAVGWT